MMPSKSCLFGVGGALMLCSLAVGCGGTSVVGTDGGVITDARSGGDARGAPDSSGARDASGAGDANGATDSAVDSGVSTDAASATDAPTTPRIISTDPVDHATTVPVNARVSATFSEGMDAASLTTSTFTVTSPASLLPLPGRLIHAHGGTIVVFLPTDPLAMMTTYTATITHAARSTAGVSLLADYVWTFTTGSTTATTLPVNLGMAGNYAMLAMSGISTVPTSVITGNLGVSPAAATSITGFSLTADATNVFSTSPQVTGQIFAADYAAPTPANLTTAIGDMRLAFADAAGRAPGVTELGAGNIGGMTLAAGVYAWGTGLLIPTDLTLTGSGTDVWIFQIAQGLTMSSGVRITLAGGALPQNIFWQVAGRVEIGTTAHVEGVIMAYTSIDLRTGASIHGRLMAQTAVNIESSTVVQP